MVNKYPYDYFHNPNPNKPIEEIWDDIDAFSYEEIFNQEHQKNNIDFFIPIPPLDYKGLKTKGFFFSQATPTLLRKWPDIQRIFFAGAYTMWSSYSRCENADAYFICWRNDKREAYFKNKYPDRKKIIFIPVQDADWTNEYQLAPTFYQKKIYDILIVASPYQVKNNWMIAKAVKVYEEKYGKTLKIAWVMGNRNVATTPDGKLDLSKADDGIKNEFNKIKDALAGDDYYKYFEFFPRLGYSEMPKMYSSARCVVLASLIEGKNRAIQEAMSCNTPIVVFRQQNQYARGDSPIFYGNSGEYAEDFTPEAMAAAIHKVINNPRNYEPRYNYLKNSSRIVTLNKIVKYMPYYKETIPEYEEGRFHENLFVDIACQINYQLGYREFIYDKNHLISHVKGIDEIRKLLKFYYSRFRIPWREFD